MIKRPNKNETEEDLLRLQEEFSTDSSKKPSATLIDKTGSSSSKKVTFEDEKLVEIVTIPVLSDIREKNLDVKEFRFRPPKSIEKSNRVQNVESTSEPTIFPGTISIHDEQESGENLESIKRKVHSENLDRLSAMSTEEIENERRELLKKLDPKLVEFLKRKSPNEPIESKSDAKSISPSLVESSPSEESSAKPILPLDEFPIKPTTEWLHMDEPEPEKMAWMASMPESTGTQEFYSARFDFKGNIVSRSAAISTTAGLHHHGQEPGAAGYTLDELLRLCRVQALNQRVLALNTLANIVQRAKSGFYDHVLTPPSLMRSLLESSVCTIMRYALDDNAESAVVATCRLLASFLHSTVDEMCLDISYGLSIDTSQISLIPDDDEKDGSILDQMAAENDMDDEALCNKDTILGLVRMGILDRFRYILEVLQPKSGRCISDIVSCLIRITRHSQRTCRSISDCPRLMNVLLGQFVPVAWQTEGNDCRVYPSYKSPYWAVIKLCRILASSSREAAVVNKQKIDEAMIRYMITEPSDMMLPLDEACQLVIGSYRLWSQFLVYGLCTDCFPDLFETMINHIRAAVSIDPGATRSRQFQWDRLAALALVVEKFIKGKRLDGAQMQLTGILDAISLALMRFLKLGKVDTDVSYYYLIASLANCICEAIASKCFRLDPKQKDSLVNEWIPKFQDGFADEFSSDSMQPSASPRIRASERDPSSLPSLESAGGQILISIINQKSLYPLFMAFKRLSRAANEV